MTQGRSSALMRPPVCPRGSTGTVPTCSAELIDLSCHAGTVSVQNPPDCQEDTCSSLVPVRIHQKLAVYQLVKLHVCDS